MSFKYDLIFYFQEGLAMVKLNEKHGYIDPTGQEIIPLQFDDTSNFENGTAKVTRNGEKFYIDKQGNRIN
jgi:hypothetical protein